MYGVTKLKAILFYECFIFYMVIFERLLIGIFTVVSLPFLFITILIETFKQLSMTYKEWKAALKKDQEYLRKKQQEAEEKIYALNRKIKDKEAEFERLKDEEELNKRGYALDKREAEIGVKKAYFDEVVRWKMENGYLSEKVKFLEKENKDLRECLFYTACCPDQLK